MDAHLQHWVTSCGTVGAEDARTCWAKPPHWRGSLLDTSQWLQKELLPLGQNMVSAEERDSCLSGLLIFACVPLRGSILKRLCSLRQDLNRQNRRKLHHVAKKGGFCSLLLKLFP